MTCLRENVRPFPLLPEGCRGPLDLKPVLSPQGLGFCLSTSLSGCSPTKREKRKTTGIGAPFNGVSLSVPDHGRRVPVGVGLETRKEELPAGPSLLDVPAAEGTASSLSGCSVGIMAFNEEANIANAISTVLEQKPASGSIAELIVVASGCTDRTSEIVACFARNDPRVRLIVEDRRAGKASAVNVFIDAAKSPILMLVSADILVKAGTIDALLQHFFDPTIGMVGGRPIPVNDEGTFLGHTVHLLWRLHDQIARESPKLGEIVAFRNIVPSIPPDTSVDEISLQALITESGYRLVYEPQAIVYNRGPTTLGDFLRQRRRIYAGHLEIAKAHGYAASTMSARRVVSALVRSESVRAPRASLWIIGAAALEWTARVLGHYDFVRRKQHHIWATVGTTKRDLTQGTDATGEQHVLVFHHVDFALENLELGLRVTRSSLQQMARRIQTTLGPNAVVSEHKKGTVIAVVSGDRSEAESAARLLVQDLTADQRDQRNGNESLKIACGIITFPPSGGPVVRTIPALAG
ncbi:MAG TPA: glycosyltransferase [Acidimicrobiales bacterium]|nr:glycosyltransferase [Acidimicrobiales bacterium]